MECTNKKFTRRFKKMSYSSYKNDKLLFENWRKFVNEKANPEAQEDTDFPMKLSDVGAKYGKGGASAIALGGDKDGQGEDDKILGQKGEAAVKDLKPSQKSMNIHKAVCFALAAILKMPPFKTGPGGDLGAIITKDNQIMDGHHRWIASGMVDPNAKVGGFIVDYPAKKLIPILNILTVHLTGKSQGKKGGGSFASFNEEGVLKVLQDFKANGAYVPGKGPWEGLEGPVVIQACEKFTGIKGEGAIAAAAKKMAGNLKNLTLEVPAGFPVREDMPMISAKKGHLKIAIDLLNNGNVDVNPPYTQGSKNPGAVSSKAQQDELEKQGEYMQAKYGQGMYSEGKRAKRKTLKESKRKVTYRRKSRK